MTIITDGSCDFYPEFFEEFGIKVVPLFIYLGDEEYLSTEIDMDMFYGRMRSTPPRTAQPSPKMFLDAINESEKPVKIFTLSSKLSGAYNSAKSAASITEGVEVIDTRQASTGIALFIKNHMEGVDRKIEIFGMPESLDLLIRNGRIGKVKGFIGKMMGILPLIELKDGELVPIGKAKNQVNAIYDELMRRSPETDVVYISHSRSEKALDLRDLISSSYKVRVIEVGPVIASHLGKGAMFVSYRRSGD